MELILKHGTDMQQHSGFRDAHVRIRVRFFVFRRGLKAKFRDVLEFSSRYSVARLVPFARRRDRNRGSSEFPQSKEVPILTSMQVFYVDRAYRLMGNSKIVLYGLGILM